MFRTTENDKVGVIGTGRSMTKNVEPEKYKFTAEEELDNTVKKLKT